MDDSTAKRLARWIFFSVLISLCPMFATYLIVLETPQQTITLADLLSQGGLQLISVVLLAVSVGELLGSRESLSKTKIVLGGISIFLTLLLAMEYGAITVRIVEHGTSKCSIWFPLITFASAIIISSACVALSEVGSCKK
jgi:hypothetical protein